MVDEQNPFGHTAGVPFKCSSIPIVLNKTTSGSCGFRVGGGIDQDPAQSPYGYPDNGIYITYVESGGVAEKCGLKIHDKILQVNGMDFTMLTHERAIHYLKKHDHLQMLIARAEVQEFP